MDRHVADDHVADADVRGLCERNAPQFTSDEIWEGVHARIVGATKASCTRQSTRRKLARVVALATVGVVLAAGISFGIYEAVGHLGKPREILVIGDATTGTQTTEAGRPPLAEFTGAFPEDIASAGSIIHSRAVITRAGQPLSVIFDLWWEASSGRYRLERRFGSSAVLAEAQVFTGDRLTGFVATGFSRRAFDWTYSAYERFRAEYQSQSRAADEMGAKPFADNPRSFAVDPVAVAGMETARVAEAARLVATGALHEVARDETDRRVFIWYRGAASALEGETGQTVAAPEREIRADEHTGLVVEESRIEQGEVVYHASREYETVDSEAFERLMSLAIPSDYNVYTDADIAPGSSLAEKPVGPEACLTALSDLSEWLPFPLYWLGESYTGLDGRRLSIGSVYSNAPDEYWISLSPAMEDIGGLGGDPAVAPLGCQVGYPPEDPAEQGFLEESFPQATEQFGLSMLEQGSASGSGQTGVYPFVSDLEGWEGVRDIEVDGWTDTLHVQDTSGTGVRYLFYLAHRGTATIAMESLTTMLSTSQSDLATQRLIAAGAALRPFSLTEPDGSGASATESTEP
jgi:hypothetical protein